MKKGQGKTSTESSNRLRHLMMHLMLKRSRTRVVPARFRHAFTVAQLGHSAEPTAELLAQPFRIIIRRFTDAEVVTAKQPNEQTAAAHIRVPGRLRIPPEPSAAQARTAVVGADGPAARPTLDSPP